MEIESQNAPPAVLAAGLAQIWGGESQTPEHPALSRTLSSPTVVAAFSRDMVLGAN